MKKIFPVITVLIGLSFVGLIIIQVQWFSNLLVVQAERFLYKVDMAAISVANDLGKQSMSGKILRLQRNNNLQ